jgi:hypothetical protein
MVEYDRYPGLIFIVLLQEALNGIKRMHRIADKSCSG